MVTWRTNPYCSNNGDFSLSALTVRSHTPQFVISSTTILGLLANPVVTTFDPFQLVSLSDATWVVTAWTCTVRD